MEPPSISRISYAESTYPAGVYLPVRAHVHIHDRYTPRRCATLRKGGRRHESASKSRHFCVYFIVHILRTVLRQAARHTRTRVKLTPTYTPLAGGPRGVEERLVGGDRDSWLGEVEGEKARSTVWRGRRRWHGELDFSDSKFCSSLFPAPLNKRAEPPPTRSPPSTTATHPPPTAVAAAAAPGFPPSGVHPVLSPALPLPRLTPTSHSFLHSLQRPGLALFFLPSVHHPRRTRVLPLPPLSPALPPRPLPSQSPSAPPPPPGAADQTSGTADTIKTGKKAAAAHTFRAVSLSLSLSRTRDDELLDAFEKLFMKHPTRFLERRVFFFPRRDAQRSR